MADKEFKLKGVAEFKKGLAKRIELDDMKRIIKTNGSQLHRKAQKNANFRGHYEGNEFVKPTGNLKKNITMELSDNDLTATIAPQAEYSAYVEYGTRFMNSQPYLRPAYVEQLVKFKNDVYRLMS